MLCVLFQITFFLKISTLSVIKSCNLFSRVWIRIRFLDPVDQDPHFLQAWFAPWYLYKMVIRKRCARKEHSHLIGFIFLREGLFISMRVQHVLKYHLI